MFLGSMRMEDRYRERERIIHHGLIDYYIIIIIIGLSRQSFFNTVLGVFCTTKVGADIFVGSGYSLARALGF